MVFLSSYAYASCCILVLLYHYCFLPAVMAYRGFETSVVVYALLCESSC